MRRMFLSASVPNGTKVYARSKVHLDTSRPVLIRDAVLAVVREGLVQGFDFIFGAHPSIAPMVLTVAREFPPGQPPRIEVFQSRFFEKIYPQETLELADGVLGTHTVIDEIPGDQERSLTTLREKMFSSAGLVGAIVIGGMDGVTAEATMFLRRHRNVLPLYAFGSTGGAALDLFDMPPPGFSVEEFCGGTVAPVPRNLLCDPVPGYARVARAIFGALASRRD